MNFIALAQDIRSALHNTTDEMYDVKLTATGSGNILVVVATPKNYPKDKSVKPRRFSVTVKEM